MTTETRIVAGAPVGIAVFEGVDHVLVVANPRWRALYGYSGACGVACRGGDLFGPRVVEQLDQVMRTKTSVHFLDATSRTDETGANVVVAVTLEPMLEEAQLVGVMAIAINASDDLALLLHDHISNNEEHVLERERLARVEAEHANRLRDQFFAVISHELRAPITTLLLWERLLRDSTSPEARTRALDAIHQSATVQARLVADLLDFSKAINGKLSVALKPVGLGPLLSVAVRTATAVAATKQVTIDAHIPKNLGLVLGDANRMQQIVDNLLSNAIKASSMGGTISVLAAREGDTVTIEVVDTGYGISPALLPHVFDAFRQGDSDEMRDGLGLGLAVAHQLTTLQHGTLTAHSDGIGAGARFTIVMPALASAAPEKAPAAARPIEDVRVLIVDDDQRLIDALQLLLERAGAHVVTARSAQEGWTELEREVPDVMISDIAMPDEDGYRFMVRIRRTTGQLGRVPAIALTAHATTTDRDRATAAGFDLYVSKPVDVDKLLGSIAALASRVPQVS